MILDRVVAGDAVLIDSLVQRYAIGLDTMDRELVLRCFADDVTLEYFNGQRSVSGLGEVAERMFHFGSDRPAPLPGIDRIHSYSHWMRIDRLSAAGAGVEGADEVEGHVTCMAYVLSETAGEHAVTIRRIRYEDRYRRTTSGWLIAARRHLPVWEAEAPARTFRTVGAASPL